MTTPKVPEALGAETTRAFAAAPAAAATQEDS